MMPVPVPLQTMDEVGKAAMVSVEAAAMGPAEVTHMRPAFAKPCSNNGLHAAW